MIRVSKTEYSVVSQQQVLVRMWRKQNPQTLLVGMQASATTLENNVEAS
jgi:hypothetical protein